ncbi:hypothetical protein ACJZ2D_011779 [Fusarium nematophilum]
MLSGISASGVYRPLVPPCPHDHLLRLIVSQEVTSLFEFFAETLPQLSSKIQEYYTGLRDLQSSISTPTKLLEATAEAESAGAFKAACKSIEGRRKLGTDKQGARGQAALDC